MKSSKIMFNILVINLLILLIIIGDFYRGYLPNSFVLFLIVYFIVSLGLMTREIIQEEQIRFPLAQLSLLAVVLVLGYSDLYFKLSRNYAHFFKNDMILTAIDSIYFSITTFTTTGYGDIYPISNSAKIFVASEMIFGYILGAFIIAILVIRHKVAKT